MCLSHRPRLTSWQPTALRPASRARPRPHGSVVSARSSPFPCPRGGSRVLRRALALLQDTTAFVGGCLSSTSCGRSGCCRHRVCGKGPQQNSSIPICQSVAVASSSLSQDLDPNPSLHPLLCSASTFVAHAEVQTLLVVMCSTQLYSEATAPAVGGIMGSFEGSKVVGTADRELKSSHVFVDGVVPFASLPTSELETQTAT